MSLDTIIDFLEPVNIAQLSNDEGYKDTQLGKHIAVFDESFPDIDHADLVIVGCGEMRGAGIQFTHTDSPDTIRSEFYRLYHWHTEVNVADLGNVKCGVTLQDSYAALRMVLQELLALGKKVLILGG
jgi:formiminoglutamase